MAKTYLVESKRLPEALEVYGTWHKGEQHSERTWQTAEAHVNQLIRFLQQRGHSLRLQDVTALDIIDLMTEVRARGRTQATVGSYYRSLRAFFSWCVMWEMIEVSPFRQVKAPAVPRSRKGFLAPEHFQALLNLCPLNRFLGARRASMLWLVATTGMRHGELAGLRVDDLDFRARLVRIRAEESKTRSERWVPMHAQAYKALVVYMGYRKDRYPELWLTEERTPLTYAGIGEDFERMFRRIGVRVKDVLHIFRRTFAAGAARQGIPRQYTMVVAGWSSGEMLDRYTRAMQEEKGAAEAFEGFNPFDKLRAHSPFDAQRPRRAGASGP